LPQLVVEPLRELVDLLEKQLRSKNVNVEALLTEEESRHQRKPRAYDRLVELFSSGSRDPVILLATAELITGKVTKKGTNKGSGNGCMGMISKLVGKNFLSLVVIDELKMLLLVSGRAREVLFMTLNLQPSK
jgi:hypothetical protein